MAGPFTREDFDQLVPADKKLQPDWVRSLTERGERTVYRGADLEKIGMPIGGICAGQLYLGGDGKLWHWDIFNQRISTGAEHYAKPLVATSPIDQGFGIRIIGGGGSEFRPFDRAHWRDVSFIGEYPIGYVDYRDPNMPISVSLEAFSPFIPLNTDDSSLPATVFAFTVRNDGTSELELELSGWLENPVCLYSSQNRPGLRHNRLRRESGLLSLECGALDAPGIDSPEIRPDIVFDDFEGPTYANWSVEGTAFGQGPVEMAKIPSYQGDVGGQGTRVVNSHASAPGDTVEQRDAATGTLTSRRFTISRKYINFLIGGGAHKGKTCMNLLIEGEVVATSTGQNENHMSPATWDVRRWTGKPGVLQIIDHESGPWGNIGVDNIVFSDLPRQPFGALAAEADFGTLALTLLDPRRTDFGSTSIAQAGDPTATADQLRRPFGQKLIGSVTRKIRLAAGASAKAAFVLTWHMPNLRMNRLPPGRYYGTRFASAGAVADYVAKNFKFLARQTHLWHDTWYDSTLPYWFLDRTFLNTSILATSTAHRFGDGRFYGWEGVGCCEGTCGHVWQYAHAAARLFPDLERMTREKVDFGSALQPDGAIHFRGEFNDFPAIDAQAGAILRALREHQMCADPSFLKRSWPNIKKATQWLIHKDGDANGLIESNQHNTLDTDWFGPVAWLSGLYLAALLAAEAMALELGDREFATECRRIFDEGQKNLVAQLFDGEYFINKPDANHLDAINSGTGCEIDQVFGQSWAFQVGLPRVFPERETRTALRSLWRNNFTPDVGPYRKGYPPGRWYAMPGEAGLLMCTFPRSDWDYAQAKGKGPDWAAGYFNECMNGFEYQAAGHMIWEGLIKEGLAVTRAVHDRYHASRRNPWNEVECGDHYARSMASYGVFLAACGFEYHGPAGHIGFAPRVVAQPQNSGVTDFQSAFTTAQSWGTFMQSSSLKGTRCKIAIKYGNLRVQTMSFEQNGRPTAVRVRAGGHLIASGYSQTGNRVLITLKKPLVLHANESIDVRLG
jgi:non-lysosomal glucosylceramidase